MTKAFGMVGIFATVVPGILLGAFISKNIARYVTFMSNKFKLIINNNKKKNSFFLSIFSFLEENDLFVPEDEDDD